MGGLITLLVLPASDRATALQGICADDQMQRASAWAWMQDRAPSASRPRILIMLEDRPDLLEAPLDRASTRIRVEAALSLLDVQGFEPRMITPATLSVLVDALGQGSPDDRRAAEALRAAALQDSSRHVTMPR